MSKTLRRLSCVLLLCLAVPFAAGANAAESFTFGDMTVYPLLDAGGERNVADILLDFPDERIKAILPDGKDKSSILAYAVSFPGRTVLFDAGLGITNGGKALEALKAAGLSPENIDVVVISHMHGDHIGGLVANGKAVFPKAIILLAMQERDWWLDPARAGERYAGNADLARKALDAYPGRVATFFFDQTILPGVTARAALGHTPGHTIYDLNSGGGRFLIVGDFMHVADIQFPHPEVSVTYDVDPVAAAQARKIVLQQAADQNVAIAGMHLPFPGIWKVKVKGSGFERVAVK